jgi:hypothetical protein
VANPSKQKGTSFETMIKNYLNEHGFPDAERTPLKGGADTGDINGIKNRVTGRNAIVQCKNQRQFQLSQWLDATVSQAKNKGDAIPALVVKRPNKGVTSLGDTYAVLRLDDLIELLIEANYF